MSEDSDFERTPPPVEPSEEPTDISALLEPAVSEEVRRLALRRLFHSAEFSRRDGLDDYDADFNAFQRLTGVVTADMRHRLARKAQGESRARHGPSARPIDKDGPPALSRPPAEAIPAEPLIPEALSGAYLETVDMPKAFISFDPGRCALERSGIPGCRRCLDLCPWEAIQKEGAGVHVDRKKCRSCGLCAAACPSEALAAARPAAAELPESAHRILQDRRQDAGGAGRPALVFAEAAPDDDRPPASLAPSEDRFRVLTVPAIGGLGLPVCFAALASGAGRVVLLLSAQSPPAVRRELESLGRCASAILKALGLAEDRISIVMRTPELPAAFPANAVLEDWLTELPPPAPGLPSQEHGRRLLFESLHFLYDLAPHPHPYALLPPGAPFGAVRVAGGRCTLCMACAGICPTAALSAGGSRPQLNFRENACVQCGLCREACPEKAIELRPRILLSRAAAEGLNRLHEESPAGCIRCGKPFAGRSILEAVSLRLRHHPMFQKPEELARLQMCRECRIIDYFNHPPASSERPK